ncbi:hypothetical protein C1X74_04700 [Pseudomonas sp. GW460-5]|nr:hypothetical protein C1X74_04700 [Pseudomonas sp. GW460-5]
MPCRSGLVPRKGRRAAPAISAAKLKIWGRYAPLSRHKAAPTGGAFLRPMPSPAKPYWSCIRHHRRNR